MVPIHNRNFAMKRMLFAIQVFALSALVAAGDEKKDAPKGCPIT
jgi:hypothetical protein